MLTRRALLSGAAPAAAAIGLAGCATPFVINGTINPAFVDQVIATLQSICNNGLPFIPTASAIADVVASLFGPAAVGSVQLIAGAVNQVAVAICAAVPVPTASLRRRLAASTAFVPIVIGQTAPTAWSPNGVTITGYQR